MNKEFEVNESNVVECWKYFQEYKKEFFEEHYSDVNYKDFEDWCEENLMECPNCGEIVLKDEQGWLNHPSNSEHVCDDCMEDCYGK